MSPLISISMKWVSASKPAAVNGDGLMSLEPQGAAGAGREVLHPATQHDSLVEVLMAAQPDVHAVLEENRLQLRAEPERGGAVAARRVERMVVEADLPVGVRALELAAQPQHLIAVVVDRVEAEEMDLLGRDRKCPVFLREREYRFPFM